MESRMHQGKPIEDWEHGEQEDQRSLRPAPDSHDDGPEFSSEPMPAAFSALLFLLLGVALVIGTLVAIFW
jgi:hypothetical protein